MWSYPSSTWCITLTDQIHVLWSCSIHGTNDTSVSGNTVPGQCGTASVVRCVVVSLPTLGLNRAQMNLGCFYILLLYYYVHIRLHCGGSTSQLTYNPLSIIYICMLLQSPKYLLMRLLMCLPRSDRSPLITKYMPQLLLPLIKELRVLRWVFTHIF